MNESEMEYRGSKSTHLVPTSLADRVVVVKEQRVDGS